MAATVTPFIPNKNIRDWMRDSNAAKAFVGEANQTASDPTQQIRRRSFIGAPATVLNSLIGALAGDYGQGQTTRKNDGKYHPSDATVKELAAAISTSGVNQAEKTLVDTLLNSPQVSLSSVARRALSALVSGN